MSTLYVREYSGIGTTKNVSGIGPANLVTQGPVEPGTDQAPITISASSAASAAFAATTQLVRVNTDSVCSVVFGPVGTTATTSNARLAANQTEYFRVVPGNIVAVITNT
jgi:hypothetical protein